MKKWIAVIIELLLVGVLLLTFKLLGSSFFKGESTEEVSTATVVETTESVVLATTTTEEITTTEEEKPVTVTISACGDCTMGIDKQFAYEGSFNDTFDKKGADYFLEKVKPIFDADDLTIANLECILTDKGERRNKNWAFRGKPEYVDVLLHGGVDAVAFANNHCMDFGDISYTDTMNILEEKNMPYASYERVTTYDANGIKVGMIAINCLGVTEESETTGSIGQAEKYLAEDMEKLKGMNCDMIVVSFHWGVQSDPKLSENQKVLGHKAVDMGADLVLGHHPHIIQGIEKYNGAYIVYSLANFCFGGHKNPKDKDTFIYQQTFTFLGGEKTDKTTARVYPCRVTSVKDYNNYQPVVVEGEDADKVIKKILDRSDGFDIKIDAEGYLEKADDQVE